MFHQLWKLLHRAQPSIGATSTGIATRDDHTRYLCARWLVPRPVSSYIFPPSAVLLFSPNVTTKTDLLQVRSSNISNENENLNCGTHQTADCFHSRDRHFPRSFNLDRTTTTSNPVLWTIVFLKFTLRSHDFEITANVSWSVCCSTWIYFIQPIKISPPWKIVARKFDVLYDADRRSRGKVYLKKKRCLPGFTFKFCMFASASCITVLLLSTLIILSLLKAFSSGVATCKSKLVDSSAKT